MRDIAPLHSYFPGNGLGTALTLSNGSTPTWLRSNWGGPVLVSVDVYMIRWS